MHRSTRAIALCLVVVLACAPAAHARKQRGDEKERERDELRDQEARVGSTERRGAVVETDHPSPTPQGKWWGYWGYWGYWGSTYKWNYAWSYPYYCGALRGASSPSSMSSHTSFCFFFLRSTLTRSSAREDYYGYGGWYRAADIISDANATTSELAEARAISRQINAARATRRAALGCVDWLGVDEEKISSAPKELAVVDDACCYPSGCALAESSGCVADGAACCVPDSTREEGKC